MSGDIYDLMTLHEVGHALWTDPEDWHKIVSADNDDDLPKSFINVTEDVRIERKIKDKYPMAVDVLLELVTRNCTGMISLVLQNVTFKNPILFLTESIFIPRSVISLV